MNSWVPRRGEGGLPPPSPPPPGPTGARNFLLNTSCRPRIRFKLRAPREPPRCPKTPLGPSWKPFGGRFGVELGPRTSPKSYVFRLLLLIFIHPRDSMKILKTLKKWLRIHWCLSLVSVSRLFGGRCPEMGHLSPPPPLGSTFFPRSRPRRLHPIGCTPWVPLFVSTFPPPWVAPHKLYPLASNLGIQRTPRIPRISRNPRSVRIL